MTRTRDVFSFDVEASHKCKQIHEMMEFGLNVGESLGENSFFDQSVMSQIHDNLFCIKYISSRDCRFIVESNFLVEF